MSPMDNWFAKGRRRITRRSRMVAFAAAAVCAGALYPSSAQAQQPSAAGIPRDSITSRLAELRGIHTPDGIELPESVQVDGTTLWVSVRGKHRANPVIVMIHGGPGTPSMPMAWAYQSPWEDFFTVVITTSVASARTPWTRIAKN